MLFSFRNHDTISTGLEVIINNSDPRLVVRKRFYNCRHFYVVKNEWEIWREGKFHFLVTSQSVRLLLSVHLVRIYGPIVLKL